MVTAVAMVATIFPAPRKRVLHICSGAPQGRPGPAAMPSSYARRTKPDCVEPRPQMSRQHAFIVLSLVCSW